MPDTYGHKPSADELLHDLTRLQDEPDSGLTLAPGSTLTGPVERITFAVEEYRATDYDATQHPTPDHIDGMLHFEHGAWLAFCDELKKFLGDDLDEPNNNVVIAAAELWGERLVELRLHQTAHQRAEAVKRREAKFELAQVTVRSDG